ncbi:sensor histidine kinase [Litoribacillus peritrichatus]|uniref:histidine kinase n=1 Tax=Litoribacillus peritrichatus TaxID=718191 RepID=A0ABP7NAS0_9GAMM
MFDVTKSPPSPPISKTAILVVDDNAANRLAMEQVLEPLGYELLEADSGAGALRLLLDREVAAILLDVQMPDMDGFETAELIRARPQSRNTPILFLTAFSQQEIHVKRGYELGAVDYMFKPFEPDILRAKVSVFVALFEKTEAVRTQTALICRLESEAKLKEEANQRLRAEKEAAEALAAQSQILKQQAQQLEKQAEALARSNEELEQFAYIASHDLQEPLRVMASFTQLLEEHLQDQMDDKVTKYIHYIVDGAQRMQSMVTDLLSLSRISTQAQPLKMVDTGQALMQALANLQTTIEETHADIQFGPLPKVLADAGQLIQVFQNLIANALKFHGETPPQIVIDATLLDADQAEGDIKSADLSDVQFKGSGFPHTSGATSDAPELFVRFCVRDNGVGVDPKYSDQIFIIFKRLHSRTEYEGSGIGLSIVKKIVERHGGKVWCENLANQGTRFYFTLATTAARGTENGN